MGSRLTLALYLTRHYLLWLGVFLVGLAGIVFIFEVAELLRRAADVPTATPAIVLLMALYKLPETIARILPFVILFAAMFTLWRMTRSQELIIMRASGVSVWQFLSPILIATLVLGFLNIMLLNMLAARMIGRYWEMEATYLYRNATLELTGAGLWLRQNADDYEFLLHADTVTLEPLTLSPLMAIVYDPQKRYLGRIDADRAVLRDKAWIIPDAWYSPDRQPTRRLAEYRIPTDLTLQKIQESMTAPNAVSFWQLPEFIKSLQAIGLPVIRHEMVWHGLLAEPWLLAAMTIFAAACSLRLTRRGGTLALALAGVGLGSVAFALNSVLQALGANQTLPIMLSVWAAPLICLASGIAALLYLEDG
jgi:lipopolysaccharide export system permease protein